MRDNSDVLSAFIRRNAEADVILARLTAVSAWHFNIPPDAVTLADVGTLGGYLDGLRLAGDAAFPESEHVA